MLQSIFGISQSLGLTEPTSQFLDCLTPPANTLDCLKTISHSLGLPEKYLYIYIYINYSRKLLDVD